MFFKLALGVGAIMIAIVLDAIAYKRLAGSNKKTPVKGVVISVVAGLLMGWFYSFVAQSMGSIKAGVLEPGKLSPYTAIVLFSLGLLLSNFIWNSIMMAKPLTGEPVPFGGLFFERQSSPPPDRHSRRCHLEYRDVFQHHRLYHGRVGSLLWLGTGGDHDRRFLGAFLSGRNSKGLLREQTDYWEPCSSSTSLALGSSFPPNCNF